MRGGQRKKPAQPKPFHYSRCGYDTYCLSTQGATFRQNIGTEIIPVVPDFLLSWSFRLSGRFSFSPVVPVIALSLVLLLPFSHCCCSVLAGARVSLVATFLPFLVILL
jgi:hypothetical protein